MPKRAGNRVIGPLALARSLDCEQARRAAGGAWHVTLTAGFADSTEELEESEDLLPDAVRLAMTIGDLDGEGPRRSTPPHSLLNRRSRTGRRTRSIAAAC